LIKYTKDTKLGMWAHHACHFTAAFYCCVLLLPDCSGVLHFCTAALLTAALLAAALLDLLTAA
jgi:hypothetical protein